VLHGAAFVEIIRHARHLGADLIVVGRHHPRRLRDAFIGSTAERVVRKSDLPVLLAASPAAGAYRNVVAAVDLSDTSRRVVELAASLIPADCAVTLVHAYDVPFESTFARSVGAEPMEKMRRERHDEAVAAGEQLRKALEPLHLDLRLRVRKGDPRVALLREVLSERADLLVVGTHARSGIAHALLGSVAEWVIRAAPCDVAVTRPVRFSFELP
jgi:nucleotide-binding universal stress UspA family protein